MPLASIPVVFDTEPPPAQRFPPVSDPTGGLEPLGSLDEDLPATPRQRPWRSEPPTLPSVPGRLRPGPCPTPFGMAAPLVARSGVYEVGAGPRVGHGPGRSVLWLVPLVAVAVAGAFGLGLSLQGQPDRPTLAAPAVASPVAEANEGEFRAAAEAAVSPLEPIRRGDPGAMSAMEAKPRSGRSVDENLALAEGRLVRKRAALAMLKARLSASADEQRKPSDLRALSPFLEDGETAKAALGVLAGWPGPEGPDVLYATWTGTTDRTELTLLARDLVSTREVRARATDALSAVLDLRAADSCEEIARVLPHVWAHGDRRALSTLVRIAHEYPCSTGRNEECHPCLRGAVSLHDVIQSVRDRPEPSLPCSLPL